MTILTPADVALKAADIIETRGLFKGAMAGPGSIETCAVCTLGALCAAVTGNPSSSGRTNDEYDLFGRTRSLFRDFLAPEVEYFPLSSWSDAEDRTADEVVRSLRNFAAAFNEPVAA